MPRSKEDVSYNMSRIRGKDTKIEKLLRTSLYHEGYRYRKNDRQLPGHPDIVLTKYKIAIFCDGDFFHGYDYARISENLKSNKEYWENKIKSNIRRDRLNDEKLVALGYTVLHYWEHEIKGDINKVMRDIENVISSKKESPAHTS